MYLLALATDYDGTLAHDGRVSSGTVSALERLRDSGRKLILVSGRLLEDLLAVFPEHDLFDSIVAENGAVLYAPRSRESRLLAEAAPEGLVDALRARGVTNIGAGASIVATWHPHECAVLETLRDLGLDRHIIFNKGAVMILPTGVNKASGLLSALNEMKISPHNVVAAGDAENDLPMLAMCGCRVAVSNALDSVKNKADIVTKADHGAGIEELVEDLLRDDLESVLSPAQRPGILFGTTIREPKRKVLLPTLGHSVLVAGPSGSGKSTAITGLLERLAEAEYQFCLFDPEGDYEEFESAITLGNPHYAPAAHEIVILLERMHNVAVNLLAVSIENRPDYVSEVVRKLDHLRSTTGRPHWIILDEAHHIFPAEYPPGSSLLPAPPKPSLMLTVHPHHLRKEALESADIIVAVGKEPYETIADYCTAAGVDQPRIEPAALDRGEVLVWFRRAPDDPFVLAFAPGKTEHMRHIRKYSEGDLGDRSFVFTGPKRQLHLAAQNFSNFIRIGSGVDDKTWIHHLHSHDYSLWLRGSIKDSELAEQVEAIENSNDSADQSREKIFDAIRRKYTAQA